MGHPCAEILQNKLEDAETQQQHLQELLEHRKLQLNDSLALQQFLADASVAEEWQEEKLELLQTTDCGKDAIASAMLTKKHQALMSDLAVHRQTVTNLRESGETLLANSTIDAVESVEERMASLEALQDEVENQAQDRQLALEHALQFHEFSREAEDLEGWISDKLVVAASRDIGKDQEDCEVLQKKADDFSAGLQASEERGAVSLRPSRCPHR